MSNQLEIISIQYDKNSLNEFESKFSAKENNFVINFPSVYIAESKKINIHTGKEQKEAYVGETNWIIQRTNEHLTAGESDKINGLTKKGETELHVIAHKKFNKSATLLIEQTLMNYLLGDNKFTGIEIDSDHDKKNESGIVNGRSNDQPDFYNREEYEYKIFNEIWNELNKKGIVSKLSDVKNSALFANSPFKQLSKEQQKAKDIIGARIFEQLQNYTKRETKIIKVQGAAGTGKTVLLSSLFRSIFDNPYPVVEDNGDTKHNSTIAMLVRHEEQLKIYEQIARKTNMGDVVFSVPKFISNNKEFDIVFVDEAHLLWTGNYGRVNAKEWKTDLEAIMSLAKVVVLIYDPNQRASGRSYLTEKLGNILKNSTTLKLEHQWRINGNQKTKEYIKNISNFEKNSLLTSLIDDEYEIKFFDSAKKMFNAIENKDKNYGLSRILATYDWKYSQGAKNKEDKDGIYKIKTKDGFEIPWNLQLDAVIQRHKKSVPWQEIPESIYESGSNFTIQGSDLNYSGVILGPSVGYDKENNRLKIIPNKSKDPQATNTPSQAETWTSDDVVKNLENIVNVLLTRGVKGLYVYAEDDELREKLMSLNSQKK